MMKYLYPRLAVFGALLFVSVTATAQPLVVTGATTDPTCSGLHDGTAVATVQSGAGPYTYAWTPNVSTAATASQLPPGNYSVFVTDQGTGDTSTVFFTIGTGPQVLSLNMGHTDSPCYGENYGSVWCAVGGPGPYTYTWLPGGSTQHTVHNLSVGTYTVVVTNMQGCTNSGSVTISQPAGPTMTTSISHGDITCNGAQDGWASVSVQGTTGPYTYSWFPVASVFAYKSNMAAGIHYVAVVDANGCMALDSVTISEPTALTATHTQADVSCNGGADGSATFVVTGGGVPPYSYNWQPVAGTDTTLANLAAGVYTATATDNSGCTISHVFTIAQPTYQLWTGAADSFWSNPANWQCGTLPDINTDVFIPLSAVQMPVIDITTAQANNVFINSGAALRFTGTGNRLEVQGDITNLGTFVSLNGTLRLSGSSYQSIPGGTYAGIELAGAGVKQSLTSLLLTSHLQANGGYLQLNNNNITLAPGATAAGGSAASFVYLNGSGRMTVQGVGMGGTTGQVLFPVGNHPGVYTPAAIQNAGTADNFTVNVIDGIYPDYNSQTPVGAPLWGFSVAKTWFITEAVNGGSDATVWLSWPLSEELPGFNNSLCDVSHYNTTTGNWEAGTIGQATGTTALFTHSRQNVTSFSPFGLGTDSQPLAQCDVHLVAAYNPGSEVVVLNWNATCDRNVERYVAERSADGIRFTEAGTKPAGAEQYSFSDAEAIRQPEKNLYYRLRLHRNNGDVLHTNIAKVTLPGNVVTGSGLVVYPNPVAGNVAYISIADNRLATDADVVLTDITGREALRQHFAAGSYDPRRMKLSTAALPAGVYHLVLKQAGAVQRAATFTKE